MPFFRRPFETNNSQIDSTISTPGILFVEQSHGEWSDPHPLTLTDANRLIVSQACLWKTRRNTRSATASLLWGHRNNTKSIVGNNKIQKKSHGVLCSYQQTQAFQTTNASRTYDGWGLFHRHQRHWSDGSCIMRSWTSLVRYHKSQSDNSSYPRSK